MIQGSAGATARRAQGGGGAIITGNTPLFVLLSCQMAYTQTPSGGNNMHTHTHLCKFGHTEPYLEEELFEFSFKQLISQNKSVFITQVNVILLQSAPQNGRLVNPSSISVGRMPSLKHVTIWMQGHLGNASLCDVYFQAKCVTHWDHKKGHLQRVWGLVCMQSVESSRTLMAWCVGRNVPGSQDKTFHISLRLL